MRYLFMVFVVMLFSIQTWSNQRLCKSYIVLDPGHGGKDSGAVAYGLKESDLTLAMAKSIKKALLSIGLNCVHLTRSQEGEFISLTKRVEVAKTMNPQIFISIHFDKVDKFNQGSSIYFFSSEKVNKEDKRVIAKENDNGGIEDSTDKVSFLLNSLGFRESVQSSELLAKSLHHHLKSQWLFIENPIRSGAFRVLTGVGYSSVLIEFANMNNKKDILQFTNSRQRDKLAKVVAKAIYNSIKE